VVFWSIKKLKSLNLVIIQKRFFNHLIWAFYIKNNSAFIKSLLGLMIPLQNVQDIAGDVMFLSRLMNADLTFPRLKVSSTLFHHFDQPEDKIWWKNSSKYCVKKVINQIGVCFLSLLKPQSHIFLAKPRSVNFLLLRSGRVSHLLVPNF